MSAHYTRTQSPHSIFNCGLFSACDINIAIGVWYVLINTFFWYINNVPIYIQSVSAHGLNLKCVCVVAVTCSLHCTLIHGAALIETVFSCSQFKCPALKCFTTNARIEEKKNSLSLVLSVSLSFCHSLEKKKTSEQMSRAQL